MVKIKLVNECEECGQKINWLQATKDERKRNLCMECYNKLKEKQMPKEEKGIQTVRIANPIILGIKIAFGMAIFSFCVFMIFSFVLGIMMSGAFSGKTGRLADQTKEAINILDKTQDENEASLIDKPQEEKQSIEVIVNSATKQKNTGIYNAEEDIGAGFVYLLLDLTIKNKGKDYFEFNPSYTEVVDSKGYSYKIDVSSYSLKPYFDTVKIANEGLASGKLSFAIPNNANGLTFVVYDWENNVITQRKLN